MGPDMLEDPLHSVIVRFGGQERHEAPHFARQKFDAADDNCDLE
jgi:hypothetical protein